MITRQLDIIVIADDLEALALRGALEYWGVITHTIFIGNACDLVAMLDGHTELAQNVLIMCHGTQEGMDMPELDAEISKKQPFARILTAKKLSEFAQLKGKVIFSSGCMTGTPAFAESILGCGAQAYIASSGYPDGDASLFYLMNLFYRHFVKGLSLAKAHEKAQSTDKEHELFTLYT
jgi:hypothetical protein